MQEELACYADNDPAALESMSNNCEFFLDLLSFIQIYFNYISQAALSIFSSKFLVPASYKCLFMFLRLIVYTILG